MTGHDDLTGLLSRSGVERWLADGDGHGAGPSVLAAIDLEDFAGVNVEYGYDNGDRVLRTLADRLAGVAGADGVAARVGGDAFLVGRRGADVTPLELGRRVLGVVSESIDLGDREAIVCGNAGVVAAVAGEEAEAVVRRVEVALDRARRQGGQAVEVAEGSEESPFDTGLSTDLHHALERGELQVHYLPTVSLADCRVEGVEALVRWDRAGVVLDAGRFLALAERTGRIVPIGRWAIVTACNDVAEWNRTHPDRRPLQLSVNLSLRQLTEPDAIDQIRTALDGSGLDAKELCLEIREDSLSQLGASVGPTLLGLKELGIRLSVDDFGTGASSLVALQRYQLDELKIDRSFVAQMDVDGDAASIVRGVVRLAESLGLDIVAAGVERPVQEQMLRSLGCRAAQGWLYARPGADLSAAIDAADRELGASLARKHVEERRIDANGGARQVEVPVNGAPGVARSLVVRAEDVAAERTAEQSLRQVRDKLEARAAELAEANDRLSVYASTVSHDLMQPVAVLAGFLSLLDRGLVDLDAEQRTWLEGAIRGKDRLVQAIDALHRHAASAEIPLGPVDLGVLVTDLVPGLLLDLGDARLEVDELPVVVGDAGLIVQVLANLVHNAGRYRHPDRPLVVEIHATREPASWMVRVSDTGKGIAPCELEAVFTAGARGIASVGTEGTGRGLATVRSLMSRMRGEAWAERSATGAQICLRFRAVDT